MRKKLKEEILGLIAAVPLSIGSTCGMPGPMIPDVNDFESIFREATETQQPRFVNGVYYPAESGYTSMFSPETVSAFENPASLYVGLYYNGPPLFDQNTSFVRFEIGKEHQGLYLTEANLSLTTVECDRHYGHYGGGSSYCLEVFAASGPWSDRTLNLNNAPESSHVFRTIGLVECFPAGIVKVNLIDDEEDRNLIKSWIEHPEQNYGIGVRAIGPTDACTESYEIRFSRQVNPPEFEIKSKNFEEI